MTVPAWPREPSSVATTYSTSSGSSDDGQTAAADGRAQEERHLATGLPRPRRAAREPRPCHRRRRRRGDDDSGRRCGTPARAVRRRRASSPCRRSHRAVLPDPPSTSRSTVPATRSYPATGTAGSRRPRGAGARTWRYWPACTRRAMSGDRQVCHRRPEMRRPGRADRSPGRSAGRPARRALLSQSPAAPRSPDRARRGQLREPAATSHPSVLVSYPVLGFWQERGSVRR